MASVLTQASIPSIPAWSWSERMSEWHYEWSGLDCTHFALGGSSVLAWSRMWGMIGTKLAAALGHHAAVSVP